MEDVLAIVNVDSVVPDAILSTLLDAYGSSSEEVVEVATAVLENTDSVVSSYESNAVLVVAARPVEVSTELPIPG